MKLIVVLCLLLTGSQWVSADQEFYQVDKTLYQNATPATPSSSPGLIGLPKGTFVRLRAGDLGSVALRITATEIQILLNEMTETLVTDKREQFLAGGIVTLLSGRRIQYFRSADGKQPNHLVTYSPNGELGAIVGLLEKKR